MGLGSRFERLAYRLQEARPHARSVLAAQMTRIIALMVLTTLGLSGAPVHAEASVPVTLLLCATRLRALAGSGWGGDRAGPDGLQDDPKDS